MLLNLSNSSIFFFFFLVEVGENYAWDTYLCDTPFSKSTFSLFMPCRS